MSLNSEERQVMVTLEYEKAITIYQQIDDYLSLGHWSTIANRLYYSVFHAVAALLINDGHQVGTHKGTIGLFGLHYIKTGILPVEYSHLYSQLQMLRNNSDYNCYFNVTKDDIEPLLEPAGRLINAIGALLGKGTETLDS